MGKKIAILQSNYIPWKGYFDLINSVDEFVVYDVVQYTKNDWRNRNKIKTPNGVQWLTIPVKRESLEQRIDETKVINNVWRKKHWKNLVQNYSRSPYFDLYKEQLQDHYFKQDQECLSEINFSFIKLVCEILNIRTKISWAQNYELLGDKTERLVNIVKQCKGDVYVSGPAAKDYLIQDIFVSENIKVEWMDYTGYREYEQLYPPFEHGVSILDLLFHTGPDAKNYMKRFDGKED